MEDTLVAQSAPCSGSRRRRALCHTQAVEQHPAALTLMSEGPVPEVNVEAVGDTTDKASSVPAEVPANSSCTGIVRVSQDEPEAPQVGFAKAVLSAICRTVVGHYGTVYPSCD